jgi:rubrerythrin
MMNADELIAEATEIGCAIVDAYYNEIEHRNKMRAFAANASDSEATKIVNFLEQTAEDEIEFMREMIRALGG